MRYQVVLEEVPGVLSLQAEHTKGVSGLLAVSENLDTHGGVDVFDSRVGLLGEGKTGVSEVGSLEDTGVGVGAFGDPLDLGDGSDLMEELLTDSENLIVRHLVAHGGERESNVFSEDASRLLRTVVRLGDSVGDNIVPNVIGLKGGGLGLVGGGVDGNIFTTSSSDEGSASEGLH